MTAMATKKLYRSPRGKIFGVCAGLAEWRDLPVEPVRWIVLITILVTGFFPGAVLYLLAALIIPMNPADSVYENGQHTADDDPRSDEDLQSEYERLKRKVEKMENDIFNKERDWEDRFHEGK
ncbi:putative stress-responsive transcriptional regulator [Sphaerochaeta pleomorpha str. Grapes]|uniref:Putative stress-responsive transcriptional regulator n=1 Tax=Sphaerochaeta pleomorpha (strain ATCC BAA-1885 / DSM 22778 / Grapes) TaxID=158190 RepID=G8QQY8_SPHPG|nr:PspC domain-containing protein [Sphaerochaeta pleomorpha]AEV29836.1 putative stress-responsive transcriptional regulator [Sphaerochaeta pleomorpha str. Grapes]